MSDDWQGVLCLQTLLRSNNRSTNRLLQHRNGRTTPQPLTRDIHTTHQGIHITLFPSPVHAIDTKGWRVEEFILRRVIVIHNPNQFDGESQSLQALRGFQIFPSRLPGQRPSKYKSSIFVLRAFAFQFHSKHSELIMVEFCSLKFIGRHLQPRQTLFCEQDISAPTD